MSYEKRWLVMSAAAVGLFLLTCGWLVVETLRLRSHLATSQARMAEMEEREEQLQQQIDQERLRNEQLAGDLEQLHNLQQVASVESGKEQSRQPEIAMLVLTPGVARDIGKANTLLLRPGARQAFLRLVFRDEDYQSYRAVLRNAAGEVVWSQSGLRDVKQGESRSIVLSLPATVLRNEDYMLTLSGVASGGEHDLADYQFRVVRR